MKKYLAYNHRQFKSVKLILIFLMITSSGLLRTMGQQKDHPNLEVLINKKDSGFRGIWYAIGSTGDEYAYKYGGGLATYPSNHYPFSVYAEKVNKTFFCYGGTDSTGQTLLHEVSYFDHKTGMVAKPTIVLDKQTNDAHDNPVMQIDEEGYIWLFSTSHGVSRPSYISRSTKPYDISKFDLINATKQKNGKSVPLNNFSYAQIYYLKGKGFLGLFTHYEMRDLRFGKKNCRITAYMTSKDGMNWSEWVDLAKIEEGQYQTSGKSGDRIATSFNYHPNLENKRGLDYRTNLYYLYTDDLGESWHTVDGANQTLPLLDTSNKALVKDYALEGKKVYINDLNFDKNGWPIILYLTSNGPEPGPANGMKEWYTAYWNGIEWEINDVSVSDNNYDMGSLYVDEKGTWTIVAPIKDGPQQYNTGGEIVMLTSEDKGMSWSKPMLLTLNSDKNHSYPRRPDRVNDDFYAFWADGNGRQSSTSSLYFCNKNGDVFRMPEKMDKKEMKPIPVK